MTAQIMKTQAEKAFEDHFAEVAEALPGDAAILDVRRAAMARFDELGLPHRRIEAWKYTDLRSGLKSVARPVDPRQWSTIDSAKLEASLGPLAKLDCYRVHLVNGQWDRTRSDLPDGVSIEFRVPDPGSVLSDGVLKDEAIVALNVAFSCGGLFVKVEPEVKIDKPIMIVSAVTGGSGSLVTLSHQIELDSNAQLTVIETTVVLDGSDSQANSLTTISLKDGARLDHIKVGSLTPLVDLATTRARLGSTAAYHAFQLIPGAPLSRNQTFVTFEGAGGDLDVSAACLGNGRDHIDSTVVVDHQALGCRSRELFKCVLDDAARGVSQGKVIVAPHAQKTDGKQMAQALMLSETAEFDSKPELEIYADDVACGHGSTSAEIDRDLVFYCRSRGIPEAEAKVLLTESFVAEAIDKVADNDIREALGDIARAWLGANHNAKGSAT